jgi:nucleoside-diphosphate-sugar epimerase
MGVFLAGATGVIGRPLVPRLLEAGHEVTASWRDGFASSVA